MQRLDNESCQAGEETAHSLEDAEDGEVPIALSQELENLANLFPFTSQDRPNSHSLEMLESLLPTPQRAWNLCESYLLHGALFFRPIKRNELMNIFLPKIYETASSRLRSRAAAESSPPSDHMEDSKPLESTSPHALAALYFTFSLGALLDLRISPYNAEAEHYYDLGRAALSLHAAYESPSMETVQAMGLMATYRSLAGSRYSRDSAVCHVLGPQCQKSISFPLVVRNELRCKTCPKCKPHLIILSSSDSKGLLNRSVFVSHVESRRLFLSLSGRSG